MKSFNKGEFHDIVRVMDGGEEREAWLGLQCKCDLWQWRLAPHEPPTASLPSTNTLSWSSIIHQFLSISNNKVFECLFKSYQFGQWKTASIDLQLIEIQRCFKSQTIWIGTQN